MALSTPDLSALRLFSAQWQAPRTARPVAPALAGISAAHPATRGTAVACLAPSRPFNHAAGADGNAKPDFLPSAATAEASTSNAQPDPIASSAVLIPRLQSLVRRLQRAASYAEKVRAATTARGAEHASHRRATLPRHIPGTPDPRTQLLPPRRPAHCLPP